MPVGGDAAARDREYLAERVRAALATDGRVLEQGLDVTMTGSLVVVRGAVPTAAVRDAVAAVVREAAPHLRVVNDVEVTPAPEPADDDVEDLT
jgi:hypothetical protein